MQFNIWLNINTCPANACYFCDPILLRVTLFLREVFFAREYRPRTCVSAFGRLEKNTPIQANFAFAKWYTGDVVKASVYGSFLTKLRFSHCFSSSQKFRQMPAIFVNKHTLCRGTLPSQETPSHESTDHELVWVRLVG